MCAFSADELLFACGDAGLRALSLHTGQLAARESTALQNVWQVAFDAHTDTLLLFVRPPNAGNCQLVSLRRNASEWLEVQRLNTSIPYPTVHMAVCDSHVLIGGEGMKTLYVFDVSAAHTLSDAGFVVYKSAIYGLACTRSDGDTLVATSNSTGLSLQRIASLPLRFEHIATIVNVTGLTGGKRLLFRGELLLIFDRNFVPNKDAIVSLRATDNALTERRVLLDPQPLVFLTAWTLAGDQLVLSDSDSNLLVYKFV